MSEATYGRKYVFQIKSLSFDITLAAKKKQDYQMWIAALAKLQADTERRKQDIIKNQKIEELKEEEDAR